MSIPENIHTVSYYQFNIFFVLHPGSDFKYDMGCFRKLALFFDLMH